MAYNAFCVYCTLIWSIVYCIALRCVYVCAALMRSSTYHTFLAVRRRYVHSCVAEST
jgi:hypothetical protein